MQDDSEFYGFLLRQWEQVSPSARTGEFRRLCLEICRHFGGRAGRGEFLGQFVAEAIATFPEIDVEERNALLVAARLAVTDDFPEDEDDDLPRRTLSSKEVTQKRKEAKVSREALLAEFNGRYAVVNENGSVVIFADRWSEDLNRHVYDRMSIHGLMALYQNRKICTRIDDEGKPTHQPAAKWWFNHEERRQYIDGVTFMPEKQAPAGMLNLWRGFAYQPKHGGSWQRLKDHTANVICGGVPEHFNYLFCWMARAVQRPGETGEIAIVMRGKSRSGKGTLGHVMRKLFGQHGMHIATSKHLVGHFNIHLRDLVLLFADEAFFAGDKANVSALKALITEHVHTIEGKFVNPVQCRNMLHIMMASNEDWVVPVIPGEVRYFVLDVKPTHVGDFKYFQAIHDELENGGYEALLYELLHHDLSGFNVRDVPVTDALQDQKHFTADTTTAWMRHVLERGYVYESKLGLEDHFSQWITPISRDLLYASYEEFARRRNERHPLHLGALEQWLTENMGWKPTKPRNRSIIVGERLRRREPEVVYAPSRVRCVDAFSLDDCRTKFTAATGLALATDDEVPPAPPLPPTPSAAPDWPEFAPLDAYSDTGHGMA